ncbi:helix-turn-helix domain-containing protein [Paenibacillus odorifer]|uniref:helix-turn-helix domain-containing protein n=1 Tax=Paenibacillus odorifer TaxID=189426 RepID=UPI00289D75C0|nr:helix-turn-helix domain-containing protein [Paenibacillus odorifer]
MSILNERIKSRRLAMNLTLQDVAEFLKVKEATAQRYESGEIKNIKHETIASLSELFKCSPAYLMGWIDEVSVPANQSSMTPVDIEILHKFNSLDEKGKHTIRTVLEMEYKRVKKSQFEVVAAHTDDYSEDQIKLMKQDLEEL